MAVMLVRVGAAVRRTATRVTEGLDRAFQWLPYFPDPKATCPAHGARYCRACSRNPGNCVGDCGGCGYWSSTGMHWDTCPNRIRGRS